MNKPAQSTAVLPDELELAAMRQVSAQPVSSQRELAERLGISVGKTNFVLRALLKKGLVKVENFRRNDHKIGYLYLLTPTGMAEKARLTRAFIAHKEADYARLYQQLSVLKAELAQDPGSKSGAEPASPTHAS
ncbi:MarR family EPS-associated transcriptional regulator [Roseateles sp. DXS20W]|uniref:MarR family EPS-associated transcriptional regulator n=1 Tax=Pelomonas lactea TaxID=3299030 RepID=A0ABW7GI51_9BURK